jgi:phosphocarrier protein HPr
VTLTKTHQSAKLSRQLNIINKKGLHARASAKFVKTAERFDAEVLVIKNGASVCGTSIMGLMMLAASDGCCIEVSASGNEAEQVLEALQALVENRFDEEY